MTRDSFRSLEGELVVFNGRLANASSKQADGGRHFLLTAVRAWRWDGNSPVPLDQQPDATADHCWVSITDGDRSPVEMLKRAEGVARVRWYARANGTADLGLELKRCLNLDDLLETFHRGRRLMGRPDQIAMLTKLLASCSKPDNYSFSQWLQTSELIEALTRYRDRLARSDAREQQIRLTQPRGRKPTSASRFADLLRQA